MLKKISSRTKLWIIGITLIITYVAAMALLPTPKVLVEQLVQSQSLETGTPKTLPWPSAKQIAIGARGHGVLVTEGDDQARPTASVAKAITALAIVRKHPLKQGEQGPVITITQEDVELLNYYYLNDGSTVPVKVGQQFTQYQALQAMLIPSANNMAATMAIWAFGSQEAYVDYANQMVKEMGLTKTHVADPSGFSEQTVSTARELVTIGEAVLAQPALAEIVAQSEADIPGGLVHSVNDALGVADINGIKTGFTHAAGGCLLFSATRNVEGVPTTVVGAILGADTRPVALSAAPKLINASFLNFVSISPLKAYQPVASARVPWAKDIPISLTQDLTQTVWKGTPKELKIELNDTYEVAVSLGDQKATAVLTKEISSPPILWRLTHPIEMLGLRRAQ